MAEDTPVNEDKVEDEDRIDEFAVQAFKAMGFTGRLSENMIIVYRELKARKDMVRPGRLSSEALATVVVLAGMIDGTLALADGVSKE